MMRVRAGDGIQSCGPSSTHHAAFHADGASEFVAFLALGHFPRTTEEEHKAEEVAGAVGSLIESQNRKSFIFRHLVGSFM